MDDTSYFIISIDTEHKEVWFPYISSCLLGGASKDGVCSPTRLLCYELNQMTTAMLATFATVKHVLRCRFVEVVTSLSKILDVWNLILSAPPRPLGFVEAREVSTTCVWVTEHVTMYIIVYRTVNLVIINNEVLVKLYYGNAYHVRPQKGKIDLI